jgi:hypothetical protein
MLRGLGPGGDCLRRRGGRRADQVYYFWRHHSTAGERLLRQCGRWLFVGRHCRAVCASDRAGPFRPQDMILDAVLGGAIAGVSYGVARITQNLRSQSTAPNPIIELPIRTGSSDKTSGIIIVGENKIPYRRYRHFPSRCALCSLWQTFLTICPIIVDPRIL